MSAIRLRFWDAKEKNTVRGKKKKKKAHTLSSPNEKKKLRRKPSIQSLFARKKDEMSITSEEDDEIDMVPLSIDRDKKKKGTKKEKGKKGEKNSKNAKGYRRRKLSRTFDAARGGKKKVKKRKHLVELQNDSDDDKKSTLKTANSLPSIPIGGLVELQQQQLQQQRRGSMPNKSSRSDMITPPPSGGKRSPASTSPRASGKKSPTSKSPRDSMKKAQSSPANMKEEFVKKPVPQLTRTATDPKAMGVPSRDKSRYLLEQSVRDNQGYGSRVLMLARAKTVLKSANSPSSEEDLASDLRGIGRSAGTAYTYREQRMENEREREREAGKNRGTVSEGGGYLVKSKSARASSQYQSAIENFKTTGRRGSFIDRPNPMRAVKRMRKKKLGEEKEEDYTGLSPEDIKTVKAMKEKLKEMKAKIELLEKEEEFVGKAPTSASNMDNDTNYRQYANLPTPGTASPFFPSLAKKNASGSTIQFPIQIPTPSVPPAHVPHSARELPALALDLPLGDEEKEQEKEAKTRKDRGKKKGGTKIGSMKRTASWLRRRKDEKDSEKGDENEEKETRNSARAKKKERKSKGKASTEANHSIIRRSHSHDDLSRSNQKTGKKKATVNDITATYRPSKAEYRMEFMKDKKTGVWKKKRVKVKKGE